MDLSSIRTEYKQRSLDESGVASTPFLQFQAWWDEAIKANVLEPNAMVLSTVSNEGKPSGRVVLLKDFNDSGFAFFTNYESKKGRELLHNPFASLTFFWPELERQIRLEGPVFKLSQEESDVYFQSRPRGSRIGAWASRQSETVANRESLEEVYEALVRKFEPNNEFPKPENWGGYRLHLEYAEFWQGRPSRLHDRLAFTNVGHTWSISRLSP